MNGILPWLKRLAGVVVVGAAVWYLAHLAARNWDQLAQARLTIAWGPLLVGSLLTLLGYAWNVRLWAWSVRWWRQRFRFAAALRIWFLSNLARFIPGTVWQFAGLAAMSRAEGVSVVAATTAILLQQVALLVTGALLALALAPELLEAWARALPAASRVGSFAAKVGGWTHALPIAGRLALVLALFALCVVAVPLVLPFASRLARRLGKGATLLLPTPSLGEMAGYVAAHLLTWLAYGVAFWLFCRALAYPAPSAAPSFGVAVGAFLVSYVAGIVVVVAPGGLGVREAVLTAVLTPVTGAETVIVLSLASRLWLVATELAGALVVIALTARLGRPPAADIAPDTPRP